MQQLSMLFDDTSKNNDVKLKRKLQLIPDKELFEGLSESDKNDWATYLYANPKIETRKLNPRNHIIGLYDPFAERKDFPAGRRWCVNVYTGCAFSCKYCYIISYIRDAFRPRIKEDFERLLLNDLEELKRLNLHAAPIHISNSTDPLQPLEKKHKHTLILLQKLLQHRSYFTTITILTKNPILLCDPEYLEVIQLLKGFQVEVTCPFYKDETRRFFEPGAPKIESRLEGIRKLRENNIAVALRIDPIFPREPLPIDFFDKQALDSYHSPQSQTEREIEELIKFASNMRCSRIIVSPLKLTTGRLNQSELIPLYQELYTAANKGKIIKKGTAYRMPWPLYHYWIDKPKQIAQSLGIQLIYCKDNLFTTH